MNEKLKANLDRVVWVVLGIAALTILVALVRWASLVSSGISGASATVQSSTMPLTMAFAVLAAVIFSAFARPVGPRARQAVLCGTWELAVAVVLSLVLLIIGLPYLHGGAGGLISDTVGLVLTLAGAFLDLGLKAGLAAICWRIYKSMPAGVLPTEAATDRSPEPREDEHQVPEHQPTWHPDQASGASWTRAGDAATGAAATSWGVAGQSSRGWQVAGDAASGGVDSSTSNPAPRWAGDQAGAVVGPASGGQPKPSTPSRPTPWLTAGQQAMGESVAQLPPAEDADDADQPPQRWKPLDPH